MSESFVGEVRLVGFNFAPQGWNLCNGQLLSIAENSTLYSLVGTTYGGDGQTTFGLPNLQGRVPIHQGSFGGQSYVMGQAAGAETVTLTAGSYPSHSHVFSASANTAGSGTAPANNAAGAGQKIYESGTPEAAMNGSMIGSSGQGLPHENMQPYLALNWIISLYGVYPSRP